MEELKTLIRHPKQQSPGVATCAITGVAGCGKSELAKAYAWEFSTVRGSFVWRLDPNSDSLRNDAIQVSYQQAFSALLYNFNIQVIRAYYTETPEQTRQRLLEVVWQRISNYPQWIVIFDNAGSYTDIKSYLPPKNLDLRGQIMITTQHPNFLTQNVGRNLPLSQGLDPSEAIQLLQDISGKHSEDEVSSHNLVKKLDYSPLGIRIAGGYLRALGGTTFEEYAHLLGGSGHEDLIQMMGGPTFINQITEDNFRDGDTDLYRKG